MKSLILFLASLLAFAGYCLPQALTSPPVAVNQNGTPIPNALVVVCTSNPGTGACPVGNAVTLYTDITLTYACNGTLQPLNNQVNPAVQNGCSNPGYADALGNVVAFANAGSYWCQYTGSSLVPYSQPCANSGGGGGGGNVSGSGTFPFFPMWTGTNSIANSSLQNVTSPSGINYALGGGLFWQLDSSGLRWNSNVAGSGDIIVANTYAPGANNNAGGIGVEGAPATGSACAGNAFLLGGATNGSGNGASVTAQAGCSNGFGATGADVVLTGSSTSANNTGGNIRLNPGTGGFGNGAVLISGVSDGCLDIASSVVGSTGSPCGSSGGAVTSVSNSDGTLNISPTTGAVVAAINLAHANTWTGLQTLDGGATVPSGKTFTIASGGTFTCAGTGCTTGTVTSVATKGPINASTQPITATGTLDWFNDLILYGGDPTGVLDSATSFTNDCAANGQVYLPNGTYHFSANYTIPCPVKFDGTSHLSIPNAVTLTLDYCPIAPPIQIFTLSGTGNVIFTPTTTSCNQAYPEWWGITGTSDQVGLNACLAALYTGNCQLARHPYNTTAPVVISVSGTGLVGLEDEYGVNIKNNQTTGDIIDVTGQYNVVKNLAVVRTVAAASGAGISITGTGATSFAIIDHVESFDSPSDFLLTGAPGNSRLTWDTAEYTSVSNAGVTQHGFDLNGGMNSTTIQDSFVLNTVGSSLHVWALYEHGVNINDLWTHNFQATATDHCIYIDGSASTAGYGSDDIHHDNRICDQQFMQSVYVTAVSAAQQGAVDFNGGYDLTYASGNVPVEEVDNSHGVTIRNMQVPNGTTSYYGAKFSGGGGNAFQNNTTRFNNGSAGSYAVSLINEANDIVSGNIISRLATSGGNGFVLSGATHNLVSQNNFIGSTSTGTGISVDSTSNFNQFSTNNLTAFTTPYSDAGASNLWNGVPNYATLTDGATITWALIPFATSNNAKVTLGGNRTLAISGVQSGGSGTLEVVQDATGSRTLTLPAGSKVINGGGGACTLSTAANDIDVLTFTYDGSHYLWTCGLNFN